MEHEARIPLFPLQRVLFPKMILPLHIFEERYKEMIQFCLNHKEPFGVIEADDVTPGAVGTAARIHRILKRYPDGRIDLLALGEERFRLLETFEAAAYTEGRVHFFDDLTNHMAPRDQIEHLITLYRGFINRLGLKRPQRKDLESILEEMAEERDISYIIGQTIGLDTQGQKELLAEVAPNARVERLTSELLRQNTVHNLARKLFEEQGFDPSNN